MDSQTLRKVQLTQLEIAKEIKRICDENHISYFLEGGTLLGAVRHKGFIPWDDDFDISMTRENYERFIKIAPNTIHNEYHIQTWDTSDYIHLPFAKVMKKGTVFMEAYANPKGNNELWVDVFPRDHYPDNTDEQKKIIRKTQFLRHILTVKCGFKPWKMPDNVVGKFLKFLQYLPFFVFSVFFSKKWVKKRWYRQLIKYNDVNTKMLSLASIFSIDKYLVPAETIEQYCELEFEGIKFRCPKEYDVYLRSIYGDYMKLPPPEERENRHRIVKVKL